MKIAPPALAPLLRSDLQGELLATLFLLGEEHSLSDLSRLLDAPLTTVHTEVERLAQAELVTERRLGRSRLVRANPAHPLTPALTELLTLTYGPAAVLPSLLADVPGIEQAYIYGSWAARRSGEPGPPPADVDVLLVGRVPRRTAARIQTAAMERLRREVNITVLDAEEWGSPTTGFATTVKASPLVALPHR